MAEVDICRLPHVPEGSAAEDNTHLAQNPAIDHVRNNVIHVPLVADAHDSFGCTIRSIPLRWLAIGFRAFDKLFYNRNSIRPT